jgi:nucleoside recognition membrane protein YjiH
MPTNAGTARASAPVFHPTDYLRFLVPSTIGVGMMLVPIRFGDTINIGLGILADELRARAAGLLPGLVTSVIVLSAAATIAMTVFRSRLSAEAASRLEASPTIKSLLAVFLVGPMTLVARIVGAIAASLVLFQRGPEWLISDATGGVILNDLIPVIVAIFVVAPFLLPLVTDFGLMELFGTLCRRVFRPLFTMPGRSSIDAIASWMGSAPVGVLITVQQYEQGFYTEREAATIATTFSVVSLAFALVIIDFVGLSELFVPYYGAILLAGLVAAIIMPRLPPLSRKRDIYYELAGKQITEDLPPGRSLLSWGFELAVWRARRAPTVSALLRRAVFNIYDIWFALLPLIMSIGALALVLTEHTPIFTLLSAPLVPFLTVLGIPEASAAAPAFLVGFADQFLPAVLGQSIESEHTRFVIAGAAVTQLVYMSELGALILNSKIPVTVGELFVIFLLRTLITVPVLAGVAALIF